jgi:hypothetical protein
LAIFASLLGWNEVSIKYMRQPLSRIGKRMVYGSVSLDVSFVPIDCRVEYVYDTVEFTVGKGATFMKVEFHAHSWRKRSNAFDQLCCLLQQGLKRFNNPRWAFLVDSRAYVVIS